jgi:hypothetical protein
MDAVREHLRIEGYAVKPEDVARPSPLTFDHINFLGRGNVLLTCRRFSKKGGHGKQLGDRNNQQKYRTMTQKRIDKGAQERFPSRAIWGI